MLNAIYEEDFLGISYGFRRKRNQHDALDALIVGIEHTKVNWILDADIRSFFDELSHSWLIRFVAHRVGDPRIVRLTQKWLKAGVLEDEILAINETGTPQGAVISPLLANIYLHYVFDLWAKRWRQREAKGNVIFVRYADDIIVGFEHENDGHLFLEALKARLGTFALTLHPEKTRLIEFPHSASVNLLTRRSATVLTYGILRRAVIASSPIRDRRRTGGWQRRPSRARPGRSRRGEQRVGAG